MMNAWFDEEVRFNNPPLAISMLVPFQDDFDITG